MASQGETAHERVRRVQEVIDRLGHEGTAVAHSDGSVHQLFPVASSIAEGEALRDWVVREKAVHTIEMGLGYGISALHVCAGLLENGVSAARHVVLDPYQATRFRDCGLQFLAEAGVTDLVEHHAEESLTALPRFLSQGRRFDLAFVDGDHHFDGVFLDLVYLARLVRPGGIIMLDDYHLPAIVRAVSFWMRNLGWTREDTADREWAVLRTARVPDTRPYDYYIEF